MALAGTAFALTTWPPLLILAALSGTVSPDVVESGPFTSLEQAMLPHTTTGSPTRLFGRYNTIATLAGSLGAALVAILALADVNDRRLLLIYPLLALTALPIAAGLSARVERGHELVRRAATPLAASRSIVQRMAALFAVDSFGGGFVVNAYIAYYLARRYGATAELLGVRLLRDRHPPSGLVPGRRSAQRTDRPAPHDGLHPPALEPPTGRRRLRPEPGDSDRAAARPLRALSDGRPTAPDLRRRRRHPDERTAAAAYTNSARYAVRPVSPLLTGLLVQANLIGAPFVIAGTVKASYDLGFWTLFRRVPLSEQAADTP